MEAGKVILVIDGLDHLQERDFDWSSSVQGYVLSSFFYGYLITQIPGGMLAAQLGATNVSLVGRL